MAIRLGRDEILERASRLPAFPRVVNDILTILDDENATIGSLVHQVERDPVVTARVLSLANMAANARSHSPVRDVATATSMIGVARVREIVLSLSLAEFARDSLATTHFWEHSVAVGVSAQALLVRQTAISLDYALVAGLLHDIGQLWMARFYPLEFQLVHMAVATGAARLQEAEVQRFGMDHCDVGRILAESWDLPLSVADAISFHHDPDLHLDQGLVPVTHVAEVITNALDLSRRDDNQVAGISAAACDALGIDWSQDWNQLFGRIEARTEYACSVFR